MKNLIIVNDFDYIQGGASKVALDTAHLLKDKYNVVFFSAVSNGVPKEEGITFICTNQNEALKEKNKIKGIINGLYNKKAKSDFSKLLQQYSNKDTIIHVHGWTKALSSSVFTPAFEKKFKVVLTLHDYFSACPNGGFFNYKKNKICPLKGMSLNCITCNCDSRNYWFKLYRVLRQFIQNNIVGLNKKLKYAIGISNLNIEILKKYLKKANIKKILNPIELDLNYSYNLNNEYYLYLGRVSKEKGVDIFCNVLSKLGKKAIVVGDGGELDRLRKKYPNIIFTGWKNNHDVKKYIRGAKALIVPSLWYEGAPLTPLEAMSFGVPCLISKKCSGREYITDNGLTFDPYNSKDLEDKIKIFELNADKYSKNSFEYVKKYNKDQYVSDIIDFYNE